MPSDHGRVVARLEHIRDNIAAAKDFIAGQTYESWLANREKIYAVVRALEIISEASRHIPDDIKARHPDVPWQDIKSAGNIYRHGYEEVSLNVIWNTVQLHLDVLKDAVESELARLSS